MDNTFKKKFRADTLARIKNKAHMTLEDLSKALNISTSTLSRWELESIEPRIPISSVNLLYDLIAQKKLDIEDFLE